MGRLVGGKVGRWLAGLLGGENCWVGWMDGSVSYVGSKKNSSAHDRGI